MLNIIVKEAKEFLTEKTNVFFFLLFPIALVFLLGNLLSSMDNAEEAIGEIQIQYISQTDSQLNTMAIEGFVQSMKEHNGIIFEETTDLEAAKALAGKDEITAVVVFSGEPLEISIFEGSNHIKNRTVGAIINGFVQTNKANSTVVKKSLITMSLNINPNEEYIQSKEFGINRSMLDYYAVTMMAMICFMSMIIGSAAFVGERQNKTINRLIAAPQNRVTLFLSKILGMLPQVVLQISILMLFSVLIFKANYASNLLDNLYLFFMFLIVTVAMISIGAVIGLVIKVNPMVIIMPFLWVMMFLAGTYSKEINIKGITKAMPIRQIQEAAFELAIFGRYERTNTVIISCFIILIIMLSIGAFIFSRKEEER